MLSVPLESAALEFEKYAYMLMVQVSRQRLPLQVVVTCTAVDPVATPPETRLKLTAAGLAVTERELTEVSGRAAVCLTTRTAWAVAHSRAAPAMQAIKMTEIAIFLIASTLSSRNLDALDNYH
jgi:hypothetical protein